MKKVRYAGRLFSEFKQFAKQNKVYWIVPLVVGLGVGWRRGGGEPECRAVRVHPVL